MKRIDKMALPLVGFVFISALVVVLSGLLGVRINTTGSIPKGIYITSKHPIEKNQYVIFCPPPSELFDEAKQRGFFSSGVCPNNYGYMMKRVAAASGDTIAILDDGVYVNGERLPNSTPLRKDGRKADLPYIRIKQNTLKKDELLLMADNDPTSWDSRYYGVIQKNQIQSAIIPIWTKKQ